MQTYVALLYSVILGEGRRVVMADLKAMAESLGLKNPRTLVATGNLVFETQETEIAGAGTAAGERRSKEPSAAMSTLSCARGRLAERLRPAIRFPTESAAAADQVAVRVMRSRCPTKPSRAQTYVGVDEKMQAGRRRHLDFLFARHAQFTTSGGDEPQTSGHRHLAQLEYGAQIGRDGRLRRAGAALRRPNNACQAFAVLAPAPTCCGAQHVVDDAGDADAEEPAIDAPPGRQPVGEVGQDRGEDRADAGGDEGIDMPAALEAELAILAVERPTSTSPFGSDSSRPSSRRRSGPSSRR